MKTTARQDKVLLLKTAIAIANELKQRIEGTAMKIRLPRAVQSTNSSGWAVILGRLGKAKLAIEIWLDLFAGGDQRRFYFNINSRNKSAMRRLANGVTKSLRPCREITEKDLGESAIAFLEQRLKRQEFGQPIFEDYRGRDSFYGYYDLTVRSEGTVINPYLCARAAAFFESVARTMPNARPENAEHEVYPQTENRKRVISHLLRERSQLLATERKIQDKYGCQVCGMRYNHVYGELGQGFAEAHHLVPLGQLRGKVLTRIEDLRTVCANCHRMLHRMKGEREDVARLRQTMRKHKKTKSH